MKENAMTSQENLIKNKKDMNKEIQVISKSTFLGKEIDVYGTAENPLFLASDVADWIEHSNVTEMLRNIDEDEKLTSEILRAGQKRRCNFLTENGLYEVLMLSTKPIAKQFKKGVKKILKSIRNTGSYAVPNSIKDRAEAGMIWVKGCKELLNLSETSTLSLMQKVAAPLGLPTPDYVPSKGILKSASELLKSRNTGISAQAFNKLAIKEGYLSEKSRSSSSGKKKSFKAITTKGEQFGENQVSPNNPKETQPAWYEDKFDTLLKILLGE